ncbi:MAG: AMIN domain-containing protein [Cyanophyceae cyanobacterium]
MPSRVFKVADLVAQEMTRVTGVEVIQTDEGLELILKTPAGQQLVPLIFPQGNNLIIDILDATLDLPTGDRLHETKVSVVRFYADGHLEFRDSSSFPGSVLEDVGLPRPEVQQQGNNLDVTYQSVSLERLDLLDGDVIFVALDAGANEPFTKFRQDPLWQKLEAVQNESALTVDSGYWIFGNVLAANAILDDLEKYLLNSTHTSRSP